MIKSKNFSVIARTLLVLCIFACVGATTGLIVQCSPKIPPESVCASPSEQPETDAETLRGQEILEESKANQ